jgi:diguanylate cyclase (GGDEF)-like protein
MYVALFSLIAILPAGITTYLSVQKSEHIRQQADAETVQRARAQLSKELTSLAGELIESAASLSGWDETRSLFVDATYYNYWKQTRLKDVAQHQGLIDAVDLYDKNGEALTTDYTLTKQIYPGAISAPAFLRDTSHTYLIYFYPVTQRSGSETTLLGYIGLRVNLDKAIKQYIDFGHSLIQHVDWKLAQDQIISMDDAIAGAQLAIAPSPEIEAFAATIQQGFTEYFIYAVALVSLLILLLVFSIARPLRRLAKYLQEIYSGQVDSIPAHFHGLIRIRELEEVRQAINDYKTRFQSATQILETRNKELTHLTYHDSLTGGFNRRAFEARLEHAVETALIEEKEHALCYIDLDQFKVVNDTCGHIAGDELLKQVSLLLEAEIRDTDMLARLGGDEFGVLLEGCNIDKAREMAEAMRLKIKTHRFVWHDKPLDIGISIGLVMINSDNANFQEILKNADAACYVAKDSGRNRLQLYQEHDKELAQRYGEMQWVSRIKQALEEDRFELYAQLIDPITKAGDDLHYELLVRLRDDDGGLVPPMAFIPAAERYNLMAEIDRWVITNTLTHMKVLGQRRQRRFVFSINLSGQSIGNVEMLDFIQEAIGEHGVDPRQLCFEITETAAITNLATATQFIRNLHELGCRFSLDDFGSGLSSFGYLSNLDIDFIKIDGEFIKSIGSSATSLSIVSAINQIGHVMGVQTIAECVESSSVINLLASIGIDFVQGFAVHKPQPLSEVLFRFKDVQKPTG